MVFRSKRFVTSILVIDVTGKSHSFTFAPHEMVFDLKSHINSKFNITSDLYCFEIKVNLYNMTLCLYRKYQQGLF